MQHWLLRRQALHQRMKVLQPPPSCRLRVVVAFVWVIYPWDTRYRHTTKQCLLFRHYIVLGEHSQTPLSTHGAHYVVSNVGKHYKQRSSYQRIATEPIRRLLPWHFIMFRVQNRPTLLYSPPAHYGRPRAPCSTAPFLSLLSVHRFLTFACFRLLDTHVTTTYRDLTARRKSETGETISPAVSKYARKVCEGVVAAGVVRFVFVAS